MRIVLLALSTFFVRVNPDILIGSVAILVQTVQISPDPWDRAFNYGMPFLLLAGATWVTVKVIIPFAIKRLEKGDEDRRVEREKFLEALQSLNKTISEASASRDRVQQTQNEAIVALTAALHERFGEQRQQRQRGQP